MVYASHMPYIIPKGEQVYIREFGDGKWVSYRMEDEIRLQRPIAKQTIGPIVFLIFAFQGWEIRIAECRAGDYNAAEPRERTHREVTVFGGVKATTKTPGLKRGSWKRD